MLCSPPEMEDSVCKISMNPNDVMSVATYILREFSILSFAVMDFGHVPTDRDNVSRKIVVIFGRVHTSTKALIFSTISSILGGHSGNA